MHRDAGFLLDIAQAARLVLTFIQGLNKTSFLEDAKTQSAVLYQLIVIGEATKRLSFALREQHPEIPWSLMAGMRDHLSHGYDTVDWEEVWKTACRDVPRLLAQLQPLLPPESFEE